MTDINELNSIESLQREIDALEPIIQKCFDAYHFYEERQSELQEKLKVLTNIEQSKEEITHVH